MNENKIEHAANQIIFGIYDLMVPLKGPILPNLYQHKKTLDKFIELKGLFYSNFPWFAEFIDRKSNENAFCWQHKDIAELIYGSMCDESLEYRMKDTTKSGAREQLQRSKSYWCELMLQCLYHRIPNQVMHEMDRIGFDLDLLSQEEIKYLPHVNQFRLWMEHHSKGKYEPDNNFFKLIAEVDRIMRINHFNGEMKPLTPKELILLLDDHEKSFLHLNANCMKPLLQLETIIEIRDFYTAKTLLEKPIVEEN